MITTTLYLKLNFDRKSKFTFKFTKISPSLEYIFIAEIENEKGSSRIELIFNNQINCTIVHFINST